MTFLFTNIGDSTRLWESAPADMAAAVQAYDVILRSAIERNGGHVFATGGDGFFAAFSSAVDAVTAASSRSGNCEVTKRSRSPPGWRYTRARLLSATATTPALR